MFRVRRVRARGAGCRRAAARSRQPRRLRRGRPQARRRPGPQGRHRPVLRGRRTPQAAPGCWPRRRDRQGPSPVARLDLLDGRLLLVAARRRVPPVLPTGGGTVSSSSFRVETGAPRAADARPTSCYYFKGQRSSGLLDQADRRAAPRRPAGDRGWTPTAAGTTRPGTTASTSRTCRSRRTSTRSSCRSRPGACSRPTTLLQRRGGSGLPAVPAAPARRGRPGAPTTWCG